ncbi:MAG: alpha-ketoglutarate-dependent dioxygenase AlkB, partial [Cyanobium sp.]
RRRPGLPVPADYGDARAGCVPFNIALRSGDLLLMDPPTQQWWQHAVPRRLRLQQERLNLTFRVVRSGRV